MELKLDKSVPFNLDHSLNCGQVFRWEKTGDWWYGTVGERVLKIRQEGNRLILKEETDTDAGEFTRNEEFGGDEEFTREFIRHYFRLDDDLLSIMSSINRDRGIDESIRKFHGLRIIRQDPWECLISYICATKTNIPAIKKMIGNIAKKFGRKIIFDNKSFYTFPEPERLARAGMDELKDCGLGYRAKYVLETSKRINNSPRLLKELKNLNYEDIKKELLALPGVGPKVADCVLLFSFDKLHAFPVDVWVRRVMHRAYLKREIPRDKKTGKERGLSRAEYERIISFARGYFGRYAGYAQEYLFYYMRHKNKIHENLT